MRQTPATRGGHTSHSVADTLGVENTIRIRHLRDKIREAYYANRHVRQAVTLDGEKREDMTHASPESTLKIMMRAKYLFLEIWDSRLLERPVEDMVEEMKVEGHPSLGDIIWQDAETRKLVDVMRNRFSAHPYFPLDRVVPMIEETGFDRFWQAARRILLFKDAVTVVRYRPGSLDNMEGADGGIFVVPAKAMTDEDMARMKRQHGGPMLDIAWDGEKRRIMQECAACIQMLKDELEISLVQHHCYKTRASLIRLVNASYDSKYMILEMHDFIERLRKLKVPIEADFLERKKKYMRYRNQYAAHNDKERRITSILELLKDPKFLPMLARDMEEATLLSRRLFPAYAPSARLRLPTLSRIVEMEAEFDRVWQESHKRLGNKFVDSEYERDCAKFRRQVDRMYGLR